MQEIWLDRLLQNRLLSHLAFWGVVLGIYTLYTSFFYSSFYVYLVNMIAILPSQILASYLLVYYQIPRLYQTKRYLPFLLSFAGSAYVLTALARFLTIYVVEDILERGYPKESIVEILLNPYYLMLRYGLVVYFTPLIMLTLKSIRDRYEEKRQFEQLKQEKTNAELRLLKGQIHPHFLFNTLNNLYVLTLQKSDHAPEVVMKLSEMLDYMLYRCQSERVSLLKEIELLQHYIDLESLRYGERLELSFDHQVDTAGAEIAPLLLLSLVENAFKHGASGDIAQPIIKIKLNESAGTLTLDIFNTRTSMPQKEDPVRQGIGLANTRQQLDLLYPAQHQWKVEESPTTFRVQLNLQL